VHSAYFMVHIVLPSTRSEPPNAPQLGLEPPAAAELLDEPVQATHIATIDRTGSTRATSGPGSLTTGSLTG
jgi:hypothetical protein